MSRRLPSFSTFSLRAVVFVVLASISSVLVPGVGLAAGISNLQNPITPPVICSSPGACPVGLYEETQKAVAKPLSVITMAAVMAALNALQYMTQTLAADTAQFLIHGGKGGASQYYPKTFEGFAQDVGTNALNSFITDMNDYVRQATGLNICAPTAAQAFNLQLSLGIQQKIWPQKALDCSFKQFTQNFDATAQSLSSSDALSMVRANMQPNQSDLGVALTIQQVALFKQSQAVNSQILNRQESQGLGLVTDMITGNIKTPAQEVAQTLGSTNPVKLAQDNANQDISTLAGNAFSIGVEQLPAVFGATLLNTLAVAGIDALKHVLVSGTGGSSLKQAQLLNPFAQATATPAQQTSAFTDIVTPNLLTTDNQNFTQELHACSTPRGLWGCSMDGDFAAGLNAYSENGAFTVAEASGIDTNGKGFVFLHPTWELIPESDTKDNQDPGCYLRAYCASNLAKLRFARILPVGWELAANSPFNTQKSGRYVTLDQVIRGFNDCDLSDPNHPVASASHPWCHLIDPSWVITAPQFQCQIKGFGDTTYAGTSGVRYQECSDVISCLSRDDKGNCVGGYGYCLSEKTAWRFDADQCQQDYVSCRTYQSRNTQEVPGNALSANTFSGASLSLIRNTIDYGSCNANTVGCQFYATTRDTTTSTPDRWVGTISASSVGTPKTDTLTINAPRTYFDATMASCDASGDGCTKLLKIQNGTSALNLIKNSSFEDATSTSDPTLFAWNPIGVNPVSFVSNGLIGNHSAEFDTTGIGTITQHVAMAPLRNYSISFYGHLRTTGAAGQITVGVHLKDAAGNDVKTKGFYRNPATCVTTAAGATENEALLQVPTASLAVDWQRYDCEFVSNSDATQADITVDANNGVQIDGVQLEESDKPTDFIEQENTSLPVNHIKIAPDELACTGNTSTDRKECTSYARVCSQSAQGCQGYTDINSTDKTEIPASLSASDYCPAACVGYAQYQKLPSAFDLVNNPSDASLSDPSDAGSEFFIPSLAQTCSAQDVGCEEFTNVESSANGGEQKADFTYVRACVKPGNGEKTYFTWEGSETTGYQLRTWSLVADAASGAPKILRKAGPDGIVKDPSVCLESYWKTGADPDCRQFYDGAGNAYYKYFSQTIAASPSCRNYRVTTSNVDDCTKTGGTSDPVNPSYCIYSILASESISCSAAATECRKYIGTTGRNAAIAYTQTFPTTTLPPEFSAGSGATLDVSNEALLVGDHSLRVTSGGSSSASLQFASTTGSPYTISFWAKATTSTGAVSSVSVDGKSVGTFVLQSDWRRFEIGPFTAIASPTSTVTFGSLKQTTYLDTITIRREQDPVYVKQNSWVTPSVCDETSDGIPQPQAMLGCRAYTDRLGNAQNVREFSRLCSVDTIGCTGFIDTRNSDSPYAQSFALKGYDSSITATQPWNSLYVGTVTTTRPADRYVYVIDDQSMHCDVSQDSCRAFGVPNFNPDWTLSTSTPFTTKYLIDDITKYQDSSGNLTGLCRPSDLFCDVFSADTPTGQVTSYFRTPANHTCELRSNVSLVATSASPFASGQYSGWFVTGTNTPCYPNLLASGSRFQTAFAGTANYEGWTSTCPVDQAECTEFRDSNDHSVPGHPDGKPYYFIDNDKIDRSACNGKVDLLSGCVLFRDMNNADLTYNAVATYAKATADSNVPETPIDCTSDSSNPNCQSSKRCTNLTETINDSASKLSADAKVAQLNGKICSVDADCSNSLSVTVSGATRNLWQIKGSCAPKNDSTDVLKVKLDRDCSTWLGCSSGETVYDDAQGKYVDLCTNLAVCDQGLGPNGKQFCAHYVDRTTSAKPDTTVPGYDSVLRQGEFVDTSSYSTRKIGFGQPDYSGYVLPNHFQVADYVTRRVGYELLQNRTSAERDKYFNDYRIAARAPLYTGKSLVSGPDDLSNAALDSVATTTISPYGAVRFTDAKYPYLNLCQSLQTKQIGYYLAKTATDKTPSEDPAYCYFAIEVPYSQNPADIGTGSSPTNAEDLALLFEQLANVKGDPQLTAAYPQPECKAYPESASPFPNKYVQTWDMTKDPPKPTAFANGYDGVPYCEFGEDCACNYRKVSYGALNKYYSPYGTTPPNGICVGGTRDGQSCVPDAIFQQSPDQATTSTPNAGTNATASDVCGGGGSCQALKSVNLVRGIFGQCLQRDPSRPIGGSQTDSACLVWNPAPLLFGKDDSYHYQPTAGYTPPPNSGEYYCISSTNPPKTVATAPGSGQWFSAPGQMSDGQFHYDDSFTSDGNCFLCSGNNATFMDGASALGSEMGAWCEDTDDDQDNGGHGTDGAAGRWIATGRGLAHSYAEYFIGLKPGTTASWVSGSNTSPVDPATVTSCNDNPGSCTDTTVLDSMLEHNFSYFSFAPITNPNGNGRLGCGYTPDWVQGVSVDNYNNKDSVVPADQKWQQTFNANFSHVMNSRSADYLKTEDGSRLQKVPCYYNVDKATGGDDTDDCYVKYWELGYQNAGQSEFKMQWDGYNPSQFGKNSMYFEDSAASKPFFSIRAVFEDTNRDDNAKLTGDEPGNGDLLTGPFRLAGFWVTATVPGTTSESDVYMYMTMGHADVCQQVAQVVAPDTRESTAFQDRVWSASGYSVPLLGYTYGSTNAPFGSALNTGPIGIDPLFQLHGPLPGAQSKLNPPTFIASGVEYANGGSTPAENWAWLTNLFARVYRVYRYYDHPVTKDSYACLFGPHFGSWCPNTSSVTDPTQIAQISAKNCGYEGTCTGAAPPQGIPTGLCNALSGVNAGLSCSASLTDPLNGYSVCHNAPVQQNQDGLSPMYLPCELQPQNGWTVNAGGRYFYTRPNKFAPFPVTGVGITGLAAKDALTYFGSDQTEYVYAPFRCAAGSVSSPLDGLPVMCSKPSDGKGSTECPRQIIGGSDSTDAPLLSGTNPELPGTPYSLAKAFQIAAVGFAADYYLKDAPSAASYTHLQCIHPSGSSIGHCGNAVTGKMTGFEQTTCNVDTDCEFTFQEWWGGYNSKKDGLDSQGKQNWLKNYVGSLGGTVNGIKTSNNYDKGWWTASQSFAGTGDATWAAQSTGKPLPSGLKAFSDLAGNDLTGSVYIGVSPFLTPDSIAKLQSSAIQKSVKRYPGAYAAAYEQVSAGPGVTNSYPAFIPGHCELAPQSVASTVAKIGSGNGPDGKACSDLTSCASLQDRPYTFESFYPSSGSSCAAGDSPFTISCPAGGGSSCVDGTIECSRDGSTTSACPSGYVETHASSGPDRCAKPAGAPCPSGVFEKTAKGDSLCAVPRYYGDSAHPWKQATCEGGSYDGRSCSSDNQCIPNVPNIDSLQSDSAGYCLPVTVTDPVTKLPVPAKGANLGTNKWSYDCTQTAGVDLGSTNLDTDNNLCTHNAGYYPRVDLCGNDPTRPECLTRLDQSNPNSIDPTKASSLPPTDVTGGLYTPSYLAQKQQDASISGAADPASFPNGQYNYISYYTPTPPTIAAPDTTRECPSSGSCPIASVNSFALEGRTQGTISSAGGQSIASIRFYGWADDNQAPIKSLLIDWGDGSTQEVNDAQIKNKKPFCGGSNECSAIPGLTCNSDADCPPAGGKCVPVGYCKAKPNVQCSTDVDCNGKSVGAVADTCVIRTTFGNSPADCEQNFFEFTHTYSCGTDAPVAMNTCNQSNQIGFKAGSRCVAGSAASCVSTDLGYCNRNNATVCQTDGNCGPLDTCNKSIAPPSGCYDVTKSACRFTPRVLVEDNWGWCTGECRIQSSAGKLTGGLGSSNHLLLNNGGCYDGSQSYLNIDPKLKSDPTGGPSGKYSGYISTGYSDAYGNGPSKFDSLNMCNPASTDPAHSPWVVFHGAYELGIGS